MTQFEMWQEQSNYTKTLFAAGAALMISGSCSLQTGWLLCWCGLGFIVIGMAYARLGPGVFGKKIDGDRHWLNRIALFPFLALSVAIWHLRHRVLSREDICNEIHPGIWLGRRPVDGELPADVTLVVDLTAEFSATPHARKLNYVCVPTLDGYAPTDEEFYYLIERLSASHEKMYIHCAAGHGRSAAVAVALLVARSVATNLADAESIVKAGRRAISIKEPQRQLLTRWFHERENATIRQLTSGERTEKGGKVTHLGTFLKWTQRLIALAASQFIMIGGIFAAFIVVMGTVLKACMDFAKDPTSTTVSVLSSLAIMCFAYWASRSKED